MTMNARTIAFDVSDCPLLAFTGPARAKSLHNLTTQNIVDLTPGESTEAFVTSPQGKTLGFFTIHVLDERIWLRCEPGGILLAMPHFVKYTMFDDVEFENVTASHEQLLLLGERVVETVNSAFFAAKRLGPATVAEAVHPACGKVVGVMTTAFGVPGVILISEAGHMAKLRETLRSAGLGNFETRPTEMLERMRVLAAWPRFEAEIKADNLPQEIDRTDTAISFRTGCYLGQETGARLDALGHVNRILMNFVLEADHLPLNPEDLANRPLINEAGQPVGEIRSATAGEHAQQAVGSALVRVKALEAPIRVQNEPEAALTLLKPAEFRERFRPIIDSLIG